VRTSKTKATPLVTIGLPVYNGEEFILQAIESLLAQDYKNTELLIIDDVSSDNTAVICESYAKRYEKITFEKNAHNLGGNGNLKKILGKASGKYFVWASQDDYWDPLHISSLVAKLEEDEGLSLAASDVVLIGSDNSSSVLTFNDDWNPNRLTQYWLVWALIVPVSVKGWLKTNLFIHGVVRTEVLKDCFRYLIGEGGHDRTYILFSILRGRWGYVDKPLYFRRKDTGVELRKSKAKDQVLSSQSLITAPTKNALNMAWGVLAMDCVATRLKSFSYVCIFLYWICSYVSLVKRGIRAALKFMLPQSLFHAVRALYKNVLL